MDPKPTLLLREPEIRSLFDMDSFVTAVEAAFTLYSAGRAELPAVISLEIPDHQGEVHVKAGYLHAGPYYAVKIASGFPDNPNLGLPSSDGMVLLFDAVTGTLAALLLDRGFITDARTGAAGAVAAKHLARKSIATVAIIGDGAQARQQARFLARVRKFREARVWGRQREKAVACVEELSREGAGCNFVVANSIREAVESADIIVTVTASREPLVRAEWISPGACIIAVGSDGPDKQELAVDLLARADRIVADSLPQCLRLGEIHHAVASGAISPDDVSELGEITAGLKPGRTSEEEIIVCDLTGVGVQDVAAASLIMERALAAGVGEKISL